MTVSCTQRCELVDDLIVGDVPGTQCGGREIELYRSYLATPPDGTFFATISSEDCTMTFTFYQSGGRMVSRSFTPNGGELSVALPVPDVERITLTCSGGTPQTSDCSVFRWIFMFHYCRCCG